MEDYEGLSQIYSGIHPSIIENQFNFTEHIESIKMFLEGKEKVPEYDEQAKTYKFTYKPIGSPRMNQEGINFIMSQITARVDKSFITSRFDQNKINRIMRDIMFVIIINIAAYQREWEVNKLDMRSIVNVVKHNVQAILNHAYEGSVQEGIFTNIAGNTRQSVEQPDQSSMMQSFISRWGKKEYGN